MNRTSVGVDALNRSAADAMNGSSADSMHTNPQETFVWYACYGSNLSQSRFMEYISGCKDKTAPRESRPYLIPHRLYFGNKSRKWDDMSVAFLDPTIDQAENTLGRIYRVTVEQYLEVKEQEGAKYIYELCLGELEGMPISTFTSPVVFRAGPPSDAYLNVIRTGLKEIWPEMGTMAHEQYLQVHICRDEDLSRVLKDVGDKASFHQRDRDDGPYMARIGILRAIRSSPHAIAVEDIRKTVGSGEKCLYDALQSLMDDRFIRAHARYQFGMFNPKTRYFTEPGRRADVERELSGGLNN